MSEMSKIERIVKQSELKKVTDKEQQVRDGLNKGRVTVQAAIDAFGEYADDLSTHGMLIASDLQVFSDN